MLNYIIRHEADTRELQRSQSFNLMLHLRFDTVSGTRWAEALRLTLESYHRMMNDDIRHIKASKVIRQMWKTGRAMRPTKRKGNNYAV